MELQELDVLIKEAVNDAVLHPSEIPAIDLYLDLINLFLRILDLLDN